MHPTLFEGILVRSDCGTHERDDHASYPKQPETDRRDLRPSGVRVRLGQAGGSSAENASVTHYKTYHLGWSALHNDGYRFIGSGERFEDARGDVCYLVPSWIPGFWIVSPLP